MTLRRTKSVAGASCLYASRPRTAAPPLVYIPPENDAMSDVLSYNTPIDPRAKIADDAHIGPFCIIGPDVTIGPRTRLIGHVTVIGRVTIGSDCIVYPQSIIGGDPQDVTYDGSPSEVVIGNHNTIRESVTIHRASQRESGVTRIGDHNYLMVGSHVGHDCRVGNHVTLANEVLLGGHVHVDDHAILSGAAAVHQFTTIGQNAFVGGYSRVVQDVPPFLLYEGHPAKGRCVNTIGLKRAGYTADEIGALSEAYRLLYRSRVGLDKARELLRQKGTLLPPVNQLLDFIQCQHEGRYGRARESRRAA